MVKMDGGRVVGCCVALLGCRGGSRCCCCCCCCLDDDRDDLTRGDEEEDNSLTGAELTRINLLVS